MTEPMTDAELVALRHIHKQDGLSFWSAGNTAFDRLFARLDAAEAERDRHANAYIELHGQHVTTMLELADARSALKRAESARDAALARAMPGWRPIGDEAMSGKPVLISTDSRWPEERVVLARWLEEGDITNNHGIDGWFVDDHKHGPYPLRGYSNVLGWMPVPAPLPDLPIPTQEG